MDGRRNLATHRARGNPFTWHTMSIQGEVSRHNYSCGYPLAFCCVLTTIRWQQLEYEAIIDCLHRASGLDAIARGIEEWVFGECAVEPFAKDLDL